MQHTDTEQPVEVSNCVTSIMFSCQLHVCVKIQNTEYVMHKNGFFVGR